MALRTFCVIPHQVRGHPAFVEVTEHHILLDNIGKFSHFPFTQVLSPAHNLHLNTLGPILESLRNKQNAAVILSAAQSGESCNVVLDICSNFLPLLFKAAEHCPIAHVSVCEVRHDGRMMTDMLRLVRVASVAELETQEVLPASAAEHWGQIMERISVRYGTNGLAESALAIRIELDRYCEVLLMDSGFNPSLLHVAHLAIRSHLAKKGSRTVAPRVALSSLIEPFAPPTGTIHVVVVPDPVAQSTQSVRLLHFVSGLTKEAPGNNDAGDAQPSPRRHHREGALVEKNPPHVDADDAASAAAWRHELIVDYDVTSTTPQQRRQKPPSNHQHTGNGVDSAPSPFVIFQDPTRQTGRLLSPTRNAVLHESMDSNKQKSRKIATEAMNTSRAQNTAVKREKALVEKLTEVEMSSSEMRKVVVSLQDELRQQRENSKSAKESLEDTQVEVSRLATELNGTLRSKLEFQTEVDRLRSRASNAEKRADDEARELKLVRDSNAKLIDRNLQLESTHDMTARDLKSLQKKETSRLRQNALLKLTVPAAVVAKSSTPTRATRNTSSVPTSSVTARAHDTSAMSAHVSTAAGESVVATFTTAVSTNTDNDGVSTAVSLQLKQLKRRVQRLEQENSSLRSTAHNAAQEVRGSSPASSRLTSFLEKEKETLERQVDYYTNELSKTQNEKDELQVLVSRHPRGKSLTSNINAVVASLSSGCESLLLQLQCVLDASDDVAKQRVVQQHIGAVLTLKKSILDIMQRESSGSGPMPTTATANESELLSQFVTFEIERHSSLRSFIPTFAQLSMAVEHIKVDSGKHKKNTDQWRKRY